jgi:uncharacterized protein YndB with AHSA1/START domain
MKALLTVGLIMMLAPFTRADDALEPIVVERVIDKPPAEVWRAFTTSSGWKEFLGVESQIEAKIGGKFEIYFNAAAPAGQRGSETCAVQTLIPGRLIAFSWNAPPKFAHARPLHTWVVAEFEPHAAAGDGNNTSSSPSTMVRLTHLGFAERADENPDHAEEWKQVRAYFSTAWKNVLAALAK